MNSQQRHRTITDEAIRHALRPGVDVAAPADLATTIGAAIAGQSQRRLPWQFAFAGGFRPFGVAGQSVVVLLLVIALVIGLLVAGSQRQLPLGGGPLMLAQARTLSAIDPQTGESRVVLEEPRSLFGVTRSNDGQFVSFWTGYRNRPGSSLEVIRTDGGDRRVLATDVTPTPIGRGSIDVWSPDDRHLATAVTAGGLDRILVVDVATGTGRLIGPTGGADNPLWSPDGEWLAFTHEQPDGRNTLAIMRRDGSEAHDISSGLEAAVSGPDNWSSDGKWIYFDARAAGSHVYRIDVDSLAIEQLTHDRGSGAPTLSPDDRLVAYADWTTGSTVRLMNADGSEPRLLIADADLRGWSADGHYVLVVTRTDGGPVQLIAVTPDLTERRVLLSQPNCGEPCLQYLSWGWPRP